MTAARAAATPSELARARMLSVWGAPLFYASWERAVFIHYEADPAALQCCVPFPLDLHDSPAFVSLVAFTLRRMRPRRGGRIAEWLLKPIATHEFLNVRTCAREWRTRNLLPGRMALECDQRAARSSGVRAAVSLRANDLR